MKKAQSSALAATVCLFAATSYAQEMTFAHGFNDNHYWSTQLIKPWTSCVSESSRGQITFLEYPSGQIVGHADALHGINTGLTTISPVAIGYETDKLPLNGITMLPGLGESSVQMVAAYRQMLNNDTAMSEEFSRQKVVPLIASLLPVYQLQSTGEPVTSMADLKGEVLRSAGGALTVTINALGAAASEIPIPDLYIALQNGTVDGALNAMSSVKPFALEEQLKSISTNGRFGSFATVLAMDSSTYQGLGDDLRQVVDDCSAQVERDMATYLDGDNESLKVEFQAMGITMYAFPDDMLAEMDERIATVTTDFIRRLDQRDLPATETLDLYRGALMQH